MVRAALAALLAGVLALAGCASLADLGKLRQELGDAGYTATSINHNTTNGNSVLAIEISMPDAVPTDEDAEKVAEVVWTKYDGGFDRLVVVMNGAVRMDATQDDLTGRFGDRPASADGSAEGGGGGSSALTVILILVGAAVFAGLMVLLWYRGRRPPPPVAPPPAGHQPGGHFQYPPQPPQG
jgi:hypothetical protein